MIKRHIFLFAISFLLALPMVFSQVETPPASSEDEYEAEYQKRIQKEYLFGVYIPKDLPDAFIQLNKLIEKEAQAKLKGMGENAAVEKLHFSFGRWMSYNWSFYEGSRFSAYLKNLGIHHPDDMAAFVIRTYHRNLNRKSLDIKPLIESIQYTRSEQHKNRKLEGELLHEEKRKRQN